MENLKPFDQMTINEIRQELENGYQSLLKDADGEEDAIEFHGTVTATFLKLRAEFNTFRDLMGEGKSQSASGE